MTEKRNPSRSPITYFCCDNGHEVEDPQEGKDHKEESSLSPGKGFSELKEPTLPMLCAVAAPPLKQHHDIIPHRDADP
jgi:hypothetical protein